MITLKELPKLQQKVIQAIADNAMQSEKIPRDNIIAKDKMIAEGSAEERKICLGWMLDTRRLLVSLPNHKTIAWTA